MSPVFNPRHSREFSLCVVTAGSESMKCNEELNCCLWLNLRRLQMMSSS